MQRSSSTTGTTSSKKNSPTETPNKVSPSATPSLEKHTLTQEQFDALFDGYVMEINAGICKEIRLQGNPATNVGLSPDQAKALVNAFKTTKNQNIELTAIYLNDNTNLSYADLQTIIRATKDSKDLIGNIHCTGCLSEKNYASLYGMWLNGTDSGLSKEAKENFIKVNNEDKKLTEADKNKLLEKQAKEQQRLLEEFEEIKRKLEEHEENQRKRQEEETRKKQQEEIEHKQREAEELKRKQEEDERKRQEEETRKKQQEEIERKQREAEELKLKQEEDERKRQEEEARKKQREEIERKQREAEELKRKQEEDERKLQEEARKKQQEEIERKRREEELRKQQEELNKKIREQEEIVKAEFEAKEKLKLEQQKQKAFEESPKINENVFDVLEELLGDAVPEFKNKKPAKEEVTEKPAPVNEGKKEEIITPTNMTQEKYAEYVTEEYGDWMGGLVQDNTDTLLIDASLLQHVYVTTQNMVTNSGVDFTALEKFISHSESRYTMLVLTGFKLDLRQIEILASALQENTSFTSVHLTNCNIDDKGAAKIASMLYFNYTIQELNLVGNAITAEGKKVFTDARLKKTVSGRTQDVIIDYGTTLRASAEPKKDDVYRDEDKNDPASTFAPEIQQQFKDAITKIVEQQQMKDAIDMLIEELTKEKSDYQQKRPGFFATRAHKRTDEKIKALQQIQTLRAYGYTAEQADSMVSAHIKENSVLHKSFMGFKSEVTVFGMNIQLHCLRTEKAIHTVIEQERKILNEILPENNMTSVKVK